MLLSNKTLLQAIYDTAIKNFTNDISNIPIIPYISQDKVLSKVGSVQYEVDTSKESFKELLDLDFKRGLKTFTNYYYDLLSNVIVVKNKPLLEIIQTILVLSKEPNFAGALIIKDDFILNPFHPLAALELTNNFEKLNNKLYTLTVYTYEDLKTLKERYSHNEEKREYYKNSISSIIRSYSSKISRREITIEDKKSSSSIIVTIKWDIVKEPNEVQDSEYFITAHQVLTKGAFVPYYGTSIIKRDSSNSMSGREVSPFLSGNISLSSNSYNYSNVCTGVTYKNSTYEGICTLSHSNQGSAYNQTIIGDSPFIYIEECIEASSIVLSMFISTLGNDAAEPILF